MKMIEELLQNIPILRMVKVQQKFHVPDVAGADHQVIQDADVLSRFPRVIGFRLP